MDKNTKVSSGIDGLDQVIDFLRMGDNVVLQVNNIGEYIKIAIPFVDKSLQSSRKVVYMRFARHEPVVKEGKNVKVYQVDAKDGFESFSAQVHQIITSEGREVFYVFDCLSDLLYDWATDMMIGNFFAITCPYLFELDTIAYFCLYKNFNSFKTVEMIRKTTQILMDVYEVEESLCIHPLKVWNRYSTTMYLPHIQQGAVFKPVTNSGDAASLFSGVIGNSLDNVKRHMDYWDRIFLEALQMHERIERGEVASRESQRMVEKLVKKLCRMVMSRDPQLVKLLTEKFSLEDVLKVKSRLVGSGLIGGKAVGMLLARKALMQDSEANWGDCLEQHDSFYIGSDVFYTYLVQNGLWKKRMEQRNPALYFQSAGELKNMIFNGKVSEDLKEQFLRMLEYFGQSPIIVRSSSLLEDSFGNAFAGKYESVYCANQGTLEQRYEEFERAVKTVFASTMSEDALTYRLKRGLDQQDEQMALLVQRVSGSHRQQYFFPDVSGVGYSYNTYVWDKSMDPEAGMLRVVAGLGTRAVNRSEGDYARIMALDQPVLKPYAGFEDFKVFSQRKVDLLNLAENTVGTVSFHRLVNENIGMPLSRIAERDYDTESVLKKSGKSEEAWILTFDELAANSSFPATMQKMLKTIEKLYQYPVDIEFTVNFREGEHFYVNLLQCRPLQVKGLKAKVDFPQQLEESKVFFHGRGQFMGGNIQRNIQRIIHIDPVAYGSLKEREKYEVARVIGRLNRFSEDKEERSVMLIGPGRWGTTTPSLGAPVSFSEINNVAVLVEVAYPEAGFAPEVSYGTHFFHDLVESDIFYVALFPGRPGVVFQRELLAKFENILPQLLPDRVSFSNVVSVYDVNPGTTSGMQIVADTGRQEVVCFLNSFLPTAEEYHCYRHDS